MPRVFMGPEGRPPSAREQFLRRQLQEAGAGEEHDRLVMELEALDQKHGNGGAESEGEPFDQVFRRQARMVLLGRPGYGKTTLAKWLARTFALGAAKVAERLQFEEALLPVVLPVAGFGMERARGGPRTFKGYVEKTLREAGGKGLLRAYKAHFQAGTVLFLIDGLDEIPQAGERLAVSQAVQDFVRELEDNRCLVTSRPEGYTICRFSDPIPHYALTPFNDQQIEAFARAWYRSLELTLRPEAPDLAGAEAEAAELLGEARHPNVRQMLRTPLILTMAALVRKAEMKLPERRAEFYDRVLEKLIVSWNHARSLAGFPVGQELSVRDVLDAFAPVAYWMHDEVPTGYAHQRQIEGRLEAALRDRLYMDRRKARETVAGYLETAKEQIGLVEPRGQDFLAFSHQTFQEYLAARELCDDMGTAVERLLVKAADPRWHEVVRLAAGYLEFGKGERRAPGDLVRALLHRASPEMRLTGDNLRLVMGIVMDQVRLPPGVQGEACQLLLESYVAWWWGLPNKPDIFAVAECLTHLETPAEMEADLCHMVMRGDDW